MTTATNFAQRTLTFARLLRRAGVKTTTGQAMDFVRAIEHIDVGSREEFREAAEPVYIRATIFVERESQKAILIGQGGAGIRRLGQRAREKVEAFLGRRVYLDLWVKALPGWRRKAPALKRLGYEVPEPGRGAAGRGGRAGRGRGGRGGDPLGGARERGVEIDAG